MAEIFEKRGKTVIRTAAAGDPVHAVQQWKHECLVAAKTVTRIYLSAYAETLPYSTFSRASGAVRSALDQCMELRRQRICQLRQCAGIGTGEVVLHGALDVLGHGPVNRDSDGNDHCVMIFRVRQSPMTVFDGIASNMFTQADARGSNLRGRLRDAGDRSDTASNNGPFVA